MGLSIGWLSGSTHPDVSVALTLLAQHNSYATPAQLSGAKYVLRYLAGSADHGIAFTSQFASSYLSTTFGWPKDSTPTLTTYTDANWGPQDASKPNPTDIISLEEKVWLPSWFHQYTYRWPHRLACHW